MENFVATESFQVARIPRPSDPEYSDSRVMEFVAAWSNSHITSPLLALKYSDGTYAYVSGTIVPIKDFVNVEITSLTTPDEIALRFQVPFTCVVDGFWVHTLNEIETQYGLYDASSSLLTSVTISPSNWGGAGGTITGIGHAYFDSSVTLQPQQTYRLAQKPTSGGAGGTKDKVKGFDVNVAGILDAYSGQNCFWSERTDAGTWTDTTTRIPFIGLHITSIDNGVPPLSVNVF